MRTHEFRHPCKWQSMLPFPNWAVPTTEHTCGAECSPTVAKTAPTAKRIVNSFPHAFLQPCRAGWRNVRRIGRTRIFRRCHWFPWLYRTNSWGCCNSVPLLIWVSITLSRKPTCWYDHWTAPAQFLRARHRYHRLGPARRTMYGQRVNTQ